MRDLIEHGLDNAIALGAEYADMRIVENRREGIAAKNGHICAAVSEDSAGFGIRVLCRGAWGFAAGADITKREIAQTAARAVRLARASALVRDRPVTLSPAPVVEGKYSTPVRIDPFAVKLEDKVELLTGATRRMQREGVKVADASLECRRETKFFGSSEGSFTEQTITECGAGITATVAAGGEVQQRTYPNSFGGDYAGAGYEFIEAMDLAGNAARVAGEAQALLTAPQCPSGRTTVILDGPQLALQVHESCGHPAEMDRVLGMEAGFAGTSFLTPEKMGNYCYGSEIVNITADATLAGGLGTYGYDDEGVPAQRTEIVRRGIFCDYLTSRETAAVLGQTSSGAMRAEGFSYLPLIRMTNINLEPGDWTLAAMIQDTKDGILLSTNRSWSIDDRRLNFQFGTEIAWEIKDGSLGKMLKNPVYTGLTPEFWQSCDAIAGSAEWQIWGVPNCGKGEPVQTARVGHGTAPARFRGVRVGVGKW